MGVRTVETEGRSPDDGARSFVEVITSPRAAVVVFVGYVVGAGIWLLVTFGDRYWFKGDEWGFLVGPSLSDPASLFQPQNTHWSTVPMVVYQVLDSVFGLGSYAPYLAAVLALHLTLAVLLRVVMRRTGVGPWVATVVAGSFVLYGTGFWNIFFGVQISMVTSMVCGVAHLVLADHDGRFDRRDAAGLALGAVGLMASGVGAPFVVIVGFGVLIRRGWRLAALHTLPLVGLYGLWAIWQRPLGQGASDPFGNLPAIAAFVGTGITGVPRGLGQYGLVAVALAIVTVAGVLLAWVPLTFAELRERAAMPIAFALGAVVVLASAATQRYALGSETALASHYQSMATALLLPSLAVGIAAFAARWRASAPILLALVVVGVPGNISALTPDPDAPIWLEYAAQRDAVLGAANSPVARTVDRDVHPLPGVQRADEVTVGYLLDEVKAGKAPAPDPLSDKTRQQIETRLLLAQSPFGDDLPAVFCTTQTAPLDIAPAAGDRFTFRGDVTVSRLDAAGVTPGTPTVYSDRGAGSTLTAQRDGERFRVAPRPPGPSFTWCVQ